MASELPPLRIVANDQTLDALTQAAPLGKLDKKGLDALDKADGAKDGQFNLPGLSDGDKAVLETARSKNSSVMVAFPLLGSEEPETIFVTQFKSDFNTKEDTPKNGNCGPSNLVMAARAFGKIRIDAGQVDAAIEDARLRMTGRLGEKSGTSVGQIAKGARSYGLTADEVSYHQPPQSQMTKFKDKTTSIDSFSAFELQSLCVAKGWKWDRFQKDVQSGKIATLGDMRLNREQVRKAASFVWLKDQADQGKLIAARTQPGKMDKSYGTGGHYMLVTKVDEQGVHVADPGRKRPDHVYPIQDFAKGWQFDAVAIGPDPGGA